MSIEGSINVSALFHDKDGTTAIKVVSLRSSDEYTTGNVAIITGTAGTAQTTITTGNVYRDASGQLIDVSPERIAFSWSGTALRALEVTDGDVALSLLRSRRSEAAVVSHSGPASFVLRSGGAGNTGTYTIVLYGT